MGCLSVTLLRQIEAALTAHAEVMGATVTTAPSGAKVIDLVVDTRIDLTAAAKAIAAEVRRNLK